MQTTSVDLADVLQRSKAMSPTAEQLGTQYIYTDRQSRVRLGMRPISVDLAGVFRKKYGLRLLYTQTDKHM